MKCKYTGCKLGGNVDKSEAVYLKRSYYHKECYREQRIKKRIRYTLSKRYKLKDPHTSLNKKIKEYCELFDAKYVLFVLLQNVKLNSIHGLIYYLNDNRNDAKYKKRLIKNIDLSDFKKVEDLSFKYNKKKKKKLWGDLILTR